MVLPGGGKNGMIHSSNMKTAISIEDEILREADETARRMGLSRSRLFAVAVADFLQRQRQEQMLVQLNEVYAKAAEPAEKRLLKGIKAKVRPTVTDAW
jgi:metal-responsive CopG/Arc/MetJ family transcriptional regulator